LVHSVPINAVAGNRATAEEQAITHWRNNQDYLFTLIQQHDIHKLLSNTPLAPGASVVDAASYWP
jgi:hypothetical protein